MAEFKIGRLRFTWAGAWATGTFYNRDAVASFNGKTYVCLEPHTSSTFYSDLAHITESGASTPYWTLMLDGSAWKAQWTPNTEYALNNIVRYGGIVYICTTQHTSGAQQIDLTKWTTYSTSDNWNNAWTTNYVYGIGDLVKYGGIVYRCITNHVSAATTALGLEVDQANWSVLNNGIDYKGTWSSATIRYRVNDIVKNGPDLWICTGGHISSTVFDLTKWNIWLPGQEFAGTWNSTSTYQPGDTVIYGGYSYLSLTANNVNNIPSTDAVDWTIESAGYKMMDEWSQGTAYKIGHVVRRNGGLYSAVQDNSAQDPTAYNVSTTYNAASSSGATIAVASTAGITVGMIIIAAGFTKGQTVITTSLANTVTPTVTPATATIASTGTNGDNTITVADASALQIGMNVFGTGIGTGAIISNIVGSVITLSIANTATIATNITFGTNAVVVSNASGISIGMSLSAINVPTSTNVTSIIGTTIILSTATTGNVSGTGTFGTPVITLNSAPDGTATNAQTLTFVGVNYLYWQLLVTGNKWSQFWTAYTNYVVGDLVVWGNTTYRCLQNHTASIVGNRPDIDTTNTYWTVFTLSARRNVATSTGDIVTYNNGQYAPVALGTTDYALRSTNNVPTWKQIYTTPGAYYVAPNGIDAPLPANGLTWDRPWKTIAYAAQQVFKGTQNPNASYILAANREFLTAEMYQWMLYQKQNIIAPFTALSDFDQTKTIRDASFIIDGIIYDMTRGGNSQSVANALAYFKPGTTDTFFNTTTAARMPFFIAALNYLSGLIPTVVSNTAISTNYQVINGVYSSFSIDATLTDSATNQITVTSNTLMTVGQPITFTGTTFGNILTATTYYVKSKVGSTRITISASSTGGIPGNIFTLNDGTGTMKCVGVGTRLFQTINSGYSAEGGVTVTISSLINIVISALTNQTTTGIPPANQSITATINVKTGTYNETLPITIPENVSIVGDELRGTVIQPKVIINTVTKSASASSDLFTVLSTAGMVAGTPVQFAAETAFGGITLGQTYYVIGSSITPTQFSISTVAGGTAFQITDGTGTMSVYGGDAIKNMFLARNGSGLRNVTMNGLLGTLTAQNQYYTQRPTGGAYFSLDPGTGPSDTSAWIFKRSPYAQNCTMFGQGCVGMKVDGSLHNGGNKSIVANDFTTILSDGIGAWVTSGAVSELVSVFAYYSYAGYFAENGGRIRATNGNTSYGSFGCIAEGYDNSEIPITATVFNRQYQAQAQVQSSFGTNAQLLKLQYSNAGSNYNTETTNLLLNANNFLSAWTSDNNVSIQQNLISPSGYSDGWTLTGTSASANSSYIGQTITINPTGATYTGLSGSNLSGSGVDASFDVTVGATAFSVVVAGGGTNGGTGYVVSNQIKIFGSSIGGTDGLNDVTITVQSTGSNASISTVTSSGTVPAGSALNYTFSVHVKQGTASSVDIAAIYSGSSTVTSGLTFNFSTLTATPSNANGGFLPSQYGVIPLTNNWYRIWFSTYDTIALNSSLEMRIYPKGTSGTTNTYSSFYGSQIEIGSAPNFYLTNTTGKYTSYADYIVNGAGTNAIIIADEIRSSSVFQTRITDAAGSGSPGGAGYLTASNNAQGGTPTYVVLAGADISTATQLTGMRLFINSGTGAGQYGYISYYNPANKFAYILKETFIPLTITGADGVGNTLSLSANSDVNALYINQQVQFIPTYYTTTVTATSTEPIQILSTTGGTVNYLTTLDTSKLKLNMAVSFTGATFGGVTTNYTYYITNIADGNNFQISNTMFGQTWLLNTATGAMSMNVPTGNNNLTGSTTSMIANMPVQFTGTALGGVTGGILYYINDVINQTSFTVSTGTITISATASDATSKQLTVDSSATLVPLNPILFSGTVFGGVATSQKYYVSKIWDSTHISISTSLLNVNVASTQTGSNLITLASGSVTTGFIANNPIKFSGTSFGGITSEQTYYILAVNDTTSFTVSTTPGGSSPALGTAVGYMTARTAPTSFSLTTVASGTMTGSSTTARATLSAGTGSMSALFSTPLFGGVVQGTPYYIMTITQGATNTIQITSTPSGVLPVTITTGTGSMQLGAAGWDHVTPGTPPASALDSTSLYYVEPRPTYSSPSFTQTTSTMTTMANATAYTSIAYGKNYWIAIPNGNSTVSGSSDGITWSSITLPTVGTWTDIVYGNNYWIIISKDGSPTDTGSKILYSASSGAGWRVAYLPTKATWTSIAYGNGVFVAVSASTSTAAYSTNYGGTWNLSVLPSVKTATTNASSVAKLSTAQKQFGATSLQLGGADYIQFASSADYAYGTNDFTIECWIRPTSLTGTQCIIDQRVAPSEVSIMMELNSSGVPRLYVNGSYVISGNTTISANVWTHVAISRATGTTRMYINGIQQTTTYTDANNYAARPVRIGGYYSNSAYFTGYIDELRISTGIARYTSDFSLTPVSAAFTLTPGETTTLVHFDGPNNSTAFTAASLWSSITYGGGKFVAVASNGTQAGYSTDGILWTSSTLPTSSSWTSIAYGTGRFVAISSDTVAPIVSFDGSNWYSSPYTLSSTAIAYGQGVFVTVSSGNAACYTSEDGLYWTLRTVTNDGYGAIAFGVKASTYAGVFLTAAGTNKGSSIVAGCIAKGRPTVASGKINSMTLWEPGSGYTVTTPTVSFFDPNVTILATTENRISNGVLGPPTFVNRGVGYNTNSTVITINGSGYGDQYQTGLSMNVNNLTKAPRPGDNLVITGNDKVYKVTNVTILNGSVAPNLTATIQISPEMTTALSPANGTAVTIRQQYSQVRLTGHDFLNIGFGNVIQSNYPGVPLDGEALLSANQAVETNYGRVFYTSTDQDGNFLVGLLFGVQQATGIVTLSATQFGLTGLDKLSLGGISVGGSGVIVSQFSTDQTFVANSNSIIPTQRAIKGYLTSRLSQGGSNTFTGQTTAGTVVIGGADKITNTIPKGTAGSSVVMKNKVNIAGGGGQYNGIGDNGGVDGDMMAAQFFYKHFTHR